MDTNRYDRLYIAQVTPYRDGTLDPDEAQLRSMIDAYLTPENIAAGVGMIINPEAGEVHYLSREELRTNVEIAVDEVRGRVPVFAGIMGNRTEQFVQAAVDARLAGADGYFALPPIGLLGVTASWNPVKYPEVWGDVLKAVQRANPDTPMICHPSAPITPLWGMGLPLETTLQLCREVDTIVGWKMVYPYDAHRIVSKALRHDLERHVGVLCSEASYFHEHLANDDLEGALSGSFNFAYDLMLEHIAAWRANDVFRARELWNAGLYELVAYVSSDFSRLHVRYKIACWLRGMLSNPFMRPPIPAPRSDEIGELRRLLTAAGVAVPVSVAEEVEVLARGRPDPALVAG
jgi:dihydrodipicolinate synthase/N-acetylneuraminate lyase